MARFLAALLALTALYTCPASAQLFLGSDGCISLPRCEGTSCPDGDDHPVFAPAGCFCAPGAIGDTTPPPACCTAAGSSCGTGGGTCTGFIDRTGGICIPPGVTYCATATSVSFAMNVGPCHTDAVTGNYTIDWNAGDCDGDGFANGLEVADPIRDPCCHNDYDCCIRSGMDAATCCTVAPDPFACCTDSDDPVACCLGSDEYSTCCLAAEAVDRVTLLECCISDPAVPPAGCCSLTDGFTGEACCEALGGPADLCCEAGIFCAMPDAGTNADTGVPDVDSGAPAEDAGTPAGDAGEPMDAGPAPLPGDQITFGGGGGCVCSAAAPRPPSALALLAALGIAIPAVVRRRR